MVTPLPVPLSPSPQPPPPATQSSVDASTTTAADKTKPTSTSTTTTTQQHDLLPRDARLIALLLAANGASDAEPAVMRILVEFAHRYTADILSDALIYAEHARAQPSNPSGAVINLIPSIEDVRLAVQAKQESNSIPKEFLLDLATQINSNPLPPVPEVYGIRLPVQAHRLTAPNFSIVPRSEKGAVPPPQGQLETSLGGGREGVITGTGRGAEQEEEEEEEEEGEEGEGLFGSDDDDDDDGDGEEEEEEVPIQGQGQGQGQAPKVNGEPEEEDDDGDDDDDEDDDEDEEMEEVVGEFENTVPGVTTGEGEGDDDEDEDEDA